MALRRPLAKLGGLTLRELAAQLVVSFAKVAEYQRRGVVHLHAVIRLDDPDGHASAVTHGRVRKAWNSGLARSAEREPSPGFKPWYLLQIDSRDRALPVSFWLGAVGSHRPLLIIPHRRCALRGSPHRPQVEVL